MKLTQLGQGSQCLALRNGHITLVDRWPQGVNQVIDSLFHGDIEPENAVSQFRGLLCGQRMSFVFIGPKTGRQRVVSSRDEIPKTILRSGQYTEHKDLEEHEIKKIAGHASKTFKGLNVPGHLHEQAMELFHLGAAGHTPMEKVLARFREIADEVRNAGKKSRGETVATRAAPPKVPAGAVKAAKATTPNVLAESAATLAKIKEHIKSGKPVDAKAISEQIAAAVGAAVKAEGGGVGKQSKELSAILDAGMKLESELKNVRAEAPKTAEEKASMAEKSHISAYQQAKKMIANRRMVGGVQMMQDVIYAAAKQWGVDEVEAEERLENGIKAKAETPAPAAPAPKAESPNNSIESAMAKLNPEAANGAAVSIAELRKAFGNPDGFDKMLLDLEDKGKIRLHRTGDPGVLGSWDPAAGGGQGVTDGRGRMSVGVSRVLPKWNQVPKTDKNNREFTQEQFNNEFKAAFDKLDKASGGRNYLFMSDLRKALPHFTSDQLNAGLRELRMQNKYTMEASEGHVVKLTPEQRSGGITEGGRPLVYVRKVASGNDDDESAQKKNDAVAEQAGPKDGDRNEAGLVFKGGRWHREEQEQAEQGKYWYGLQNRPAGHATVPKGATEYAKHDGFRHGKVSYDRPLTDKEIYDYELTPIRHDSEIPDLAKKVAAEMGEYVNDYLAPGNEELLDDKLKQADVKKILGHVDHAKVIAELRKQAGGTQPEEAATQEQAAAAPAEDQEVKDIKAAINSVGGPDELTVDNIEKIRRDLYPKYGPKITPRIVRAFAEQIRQSVDVSKPGNEKQAKKGPKEGDKNAEGLVFHNSRWHREGAVDALDITPDNVDRYIDQETKKLLSDGRTYSPNSARSMAAGRILKAFDKRAGEFIESIDTRVQEGDEFTEHEDELYASMRNRRRALYDALVRETGYRPGAIDPDHPDLDEPLGPLGDNKKPTEQQLADMLKGIDKSGAEAVLQQFEEKKKARDIQVEKLQREADELRDSREGKSGPALGAINRKIAKLVDKKAEVKDSVYAGSDVYQAMAALLAHDETKPIYARYAAAAGITEDVNSWSWSARRRELADMLAGVAGGDERLAMSIATEMMRVPLGAEQIIAQEKDRHARRKVIERIHQLIDEQPDLSKLEKENAKARYHDNSIHPGRYDTYAKDITDENDRERQRKKREREAAEERQRRVDAGIKITQAARALIDGKHTGEEPSQDTLKEAVRLLIHEEPNQWRKASKDDIEHKGATAKDIASVHSKHAADAVGYVRHGNIIIKATSAIKEESGRYPDADDQNFQRTYNNQIERHLEDAKGKDEAPAKVVAKKGGRHLIIAGKDGSGNKRKAIVSESAVATILRHHPGSMIGITEDNWVVFTNKNNEVTGVIGGGSTDVDDESLVPPKRLEDILEPGPYSPSDVKLQYSTHKVGHFVVGNHGLSKALRSKPPSDLNAKDDSGDIDKNMRKKVLSFVHGADEDGEPIFHPKGKKSDLPDEHKTARDYWAKLRELSRQPSLGADESGHQRVSENFSIVQGKGGWRDKPDGTFTLKHRKSGSTLPFKADSVMKAKLLAHALEHMDGVNWDRKAYNLDDPKDKEEVEMVKEVAAAVKEGDYHPAMGGHTRLMKISKAIHEEADRSGISARDLKYAVNHVHEMEKQQLSDRATAVDAVKTKLGLTSRKIADIENSGKDYSSIPKFDDIARTVAREYPDLAIGAGYDSETNASDEEDYSQKLWNILREPTPRPRDPNDPSLISDAANLVLDNKPVTKVSDDLDWLSDDTIEDDGMGQYEDDGGREMSLRPKKLPAIPPCLAVRDGHVTMVNRWPQGVRGIVESLFHGDTGTREAVNQFRSLLYGQRMSFVFIGPRTKRQRVVSSRDEIPKSILKTGQYTEHKDIEEHEIRALAGHASRTFQGLNVPKHLHEQAMELFHLGAAGHTPMDKVIERFQEIAEQVRNAGKKARGEVTATAPKAEAPAPAEPVAPAAPVAPDPLTAEPTSVSDFGREIPGARKHTASSRTSKPGADKERKPPWRARYGVHQDTKGKFFITLNDNLLYRSWTSSGIKESYDTPEEAESHIKLHAIASNFRIRNESKAGSPPAYAIVKKVSDKKFPVVKGGFATEEEAKRYIFDNQDEILNHKFPNWEDYSYLDHVERVGPSVRSGKITESEFQKEFNFSGGQFGNWQTNRDGVEAINHAYDSLHDLSRATGLSPKQLSLDGKLAIAFGARGHGGLHAAKAHYEPKEQVMNLTKMNGAGSLAHEWFHALDHHVAKLEHGEHTEKLLTNAITYSPKNKEIVEAWRGLIGTMREKDETKQLATEHTSKLFGLAKKHVDDLLDEITKSMQRGKKKGLTEAQQAEFDSLVADISGNRAGKIAYIGMTRTSYEKIEKLNSLYKIATGRSFSTSDTSSYGVRLYHAVRHMADAKSKLDSAADGGTETVRRRSDFFLESAKLDKSRSSDYYQLPHEMAARAFAGYVEDKLAERGEKSDYLVAKASNKPYQDMGLDAKPYPEGEERKAINAQFDKLFDVVRGSLSGGSGKPKNEEGEHTKTEATVNNPVPTAANAGTQEANAGPQEGDRNAEGLVFRDGRWHREEAAQASGKEPHEMTAAEIAQHPKLSFYKWELNRHDWGKRRAITEPQSDGSVTVKAGLAGSNHKIAIATFSNESSANHYARDWEAGMAFPIMGHSQLSHLMDSAKRVSQLMTKNGAVDQPVFTGGSRIGVDGNLGTEGYLNTAISSMRVTASQLQKWYEQGKSLRYIDPVSGFPVRPVDHRAAVESALAAGNPVPPEVLAEYPDIAQKADAGPPEFAKEAGFSTWKQLEKIGLRPFVERAPEVVLELLKPVATKLRAGITPSVVNKVAGELIWRMRTGIGSNTAAKELAYAYDNRDNGEPGDVQHNQSIASALRQYAINESARKYAPQEAENGPHEGDRNAEGLVFHDGRWHREDAGQAGEKEPHEMTREEYRKYFDDGGKTPMPMSGADVIASMDWGRQHFGPDAKNRLLHGDAGDTQHLLLIANQLRQGKPVPSKVLADYPDLAKANTTPEPVAANTEGSIANEQGTGPGAGTIPDAGGDRSGSGVPEQRRVDSGVPDGAVRKEAGNGTQRIVTDRSEFTSPAKTELVPENLRQHLTSDQQAGVAKALEAMDRYGGFLLADGTGVGKTRQLLAIADRYAKQGKKVVIVAPAEVIKPKWDKGTTAKKGSYTKDGAAMGVGFRLVRGSDPLPTGTVSLTTYNNIGDIAKQADSNTVVLFDESHYMKNSSSARSKHGKTIGFNAGKVMYATATPADKALHLGHLLRAGVFGGGDERSGKFWGKAADTYAKLGLIQKTVYNRHAGREITSWVVNPKLGHDEVTRRISGLMDQMTKDGLMIQRTLSMDNVDARLHPITLSDEAKRATTKVYDDMMDEHDNKAIALMAMRRSQEPHKISEVGRLVQEELAAGRQPIVFLGRVNDLTADEDSDDDEDSVDDNTAKLLKQHLLGIGISEADIGELHGAATKTADAKSRAMEHFNDGKTKVLISTIQSGGTGVNLDDTVGDRPRTVIMMTPPLSANDMIQAAGRVNRLTTKSPAKLVTLVSDHEVDEWNMALLAKKMETSGAALAKNMAQLIEKHRPAENGRFDWGQSLIRTKLPPGAPAGAPAGAAATPEPAPQPVGPAPSPFVEKSTAKFTAEQKRVIHAAAKWLHSLNDDRAREVNGMGYNKFDGEHGAALANLPELSDAQAERGLKMLRKYQGQLNNANLTLPHDSHIQRDEPPKPQAVSQQPTKKVNTKNGERHIISWRPASKFWDLRKAGKLPSEVSVKKNDRTGEWEATIWGTSPDHANQVYSKLRELGGQNMALKQRTVTDVMAEIVRILQQLHDGDMTSEEAEEAYRALLSGGGQAMSHNVLKMIRSFKKVAPLKRKPRGRRNVVICMENNKLVAR